MSTELQNPEPAELTPEEWDELEKRLKGNEHYYIIEVLRHDNNKPVRIDTLNFIKPKLKPRKIRADGRRSARLLATAIAKKGLGFKLVIMSHKHRRNAKDQQTIGLIRVKPEQSPVKE